MPAFVGPVVPPGRMSAADQPTLHVDELTLRPWLPSDAVAVVAAYADPEIQRWHVRSVTDDEAPAWIDAARGAWAAETAANWAVVRGGELAGRMTVKTVLGFGVGVIAYWVVPGARGLGIAPRGLRCATRWAFELGLHRLELDHSTANDASCRVATKAGYGLEGTLRSKALHADGWHDMHCHVRVLGD